MRTSWAPWWFEAPGVPLEPLMQTPYFDSRIKRVSNSSLLASCYSALFSPFPFLYWFSSLAVCFTLFALRYFFLRLTARFSLLPFYYSLTFNRSSLLVGQFYFFAAWLLLPFAGHSPLFECYILLDACCSSFLNSLLALVNRWLLYANHRLLPAAHLR